MTDEQWEQLRPFAEAMEHSWNIFVEYKRSMQSNLYYTGGQALRRKMEAEITADEFRQAWLKTKTAYDAQRLKVLGF